jgi:hypothetical protein
MTELFVGLGRRAVSKKASNDASKQQHHGVI